MCDCESVRVSNKVMEDESDEEVSFNLQRYTAPITMPSLTNWASFGTQKQRPIVRRPELIRLMKASSGVGKKWRTN